MAAAKHSINELKNNPIFQLSLSSKELFHSNFLCWLAEDPNTERIFKNVLELFGFESGEADMIAKGLRGNDPQYMALREYNKFDFCICERIKNPDPNNGDIYVPGQILLLLENKFKSLPHIAQLNEYLEKSRNLNLAAQTVAAKNVYLADHERPKRWSKKYYVNSLNSISKIETKFVLLSLVDKMEGLTLNDSLFNVANSTWKYVSYANYATSLLNAINSIKLFNFTNNLIEHYASFLETFYDILNKGSEENACHLPSNITKASWSILLCKDDLRSIRMEDVWQKLIASIIANEISKKIDKRLNVRYNKKAEEILCSPNDRNEYISPGDIIVGVGFSRGSAIIDVKLKLNDSFLFGLQIQGNAYKRLLERASATEKRCKWENILNKFKGFYRMDNSNWVNPSLNIFDENVGIRPQNKSSKSGLTNFDRFNDTFIYQSKQIRANAIIDDVISAVLEDVDRARKLVLK